MTQYFKNQISSYKITKDFSEHKTSGLRLEVRSMLRSDDKYFQRQRKMYWYLEEKEAYCPASQEQGLRTETYM